MPITIQSGAHQFNAPNVTKYSLMMGGMDTRHDALKQYDVMTTRFYRLFMVRTPEHLKKYFEKDQTKLKAYKHILEYGNLGVSGLSDSEVQFGDVTGGFVGKKFYIPQKQENNTEEITIKVVEFSGSLMREMHHTWINMVVDSDSGFTHYNGMIASGELGYSQANQTAEFIYVVTDRTGMKVEYAVHLTNCFPTNIPTDHFNADDPSDHPIVTLDLKFKCSARDGWDVNEKAKILLKNHQILVNSLEYHTGLTNSDINNLGYSGYDPSNGQLVDRASGSSKTVGGSTYRSKLNKSAGETTLPSRSEKYTNTATPSYTEWGNKVGEI